MAISEKVKKFLDDNKVKYEVRAHDKAFTAQGLARTDHVSGKNVAKVVLLKTRKGHAMALLQAHKMLDMSAAKHATGEKGLGLAEESDFQSLFPDCEVGATSPFGNLYGIPVYVDEWLAQDDEVEFNAGTHTEAVRMKYADFARLAKPKVARLTAD